MKTIKIVLVLLVMYSSSMLAQVTTVVDQYSSNLTKNDLNFEGSRVLHCIGLNDKNSENYIVVSKNGQGEDDDHLYLEKFTKTPLGYEKTFRTHFEHPTNLACLL